MRRLLYAGVLAAAVTGAAPAAAPGGRQAAPGADPEALRPRFHFTPVRNFMNDPNGLVFYKGEYHLFYQHNPFGATWGHMSWGHAVSRDLLHWEHLPVALREEHGVMIFSGSAVVDWRNTSGLCRPQDGDASCLIAIYTGHTRERQTQNLAYSHDRGRTWTKYAGNPVIDLGLKDFRDPKVFWHEPTSRWILVAVLADQHKVRFFGSRDLKKWETLSDFGPAGAIGGVWECPDLFELPVDGNPSVTKWVLDVDINPGAVAGGSGGQYFVGAFDGARFTNDNPPETMLWADYGKDFYATISFSDIPATDGRRIWMAWISNWLYANQEPTEIWRGAQSVPREVGLRRFPEGIRLVQSPVREVTRLRATGMPGTIDEARPITGSVEIELEIARGDWKDAGFRLTNARGEEAIVGVSASPLELFVDRRRSRATPFHEAYPGRHAGPIRWRADRVRVRVLFDRSVLEVFGNDGETVITDRVFPTQPFDRLELLPGGRAGVRAARLWDLRLTASGAPVARED